ncbi:MAG: WG repeat-containing protein [Oscillospiraceae bacterium]|nr:WG repeat-containing protein [Oscillospiraceae bacterium]
MENCKIALSFDAGGHALVQRADDTWVYMDTNGEMMDAGSYKDVRFELFSAVDYALAQRADDTWVHMDANGEIRVPSDQRELYAKPAADFEHADERADARMFGEPGAYYYQLFDMNGKLLNDTKFQVIGRFYRGLALIVQDRKVGLIDAKGNVVIAPVFPYDETGYEIDENKFHRYAPYYMKDDAIVIPYNGKVALLIITRA